MHRVLFVIAIAKIWWAIRERARFSRSLKRRNIFGNGNATVTRPCCDPQRLVPTLRRATRLPPERAPIAVLTATPPRAPRAHRHSAVQVRRLPIPSPAQQRQKSSLISPTTLRPIRRWPSPAALTSNRQRPTNHSSPLRAPQAQLRLARTYSNTDHAPARLKHEWRLSGGIQLLLIPRHNSGP